MGEATISVRRNSHAHAVLLAGTLRPSPIREVLNVPEVCLPVDHDALLLDAWRGALGTVGNVLIVVNSDSDVRSIEAAESRSQLRGARHPLRIVAEPTAWRGTGI